ncbi:hypothetical protein RhiirA5_413664 [Rhizophagus irregularis]|uniref:Uncharacterized protein n=1 Tax=Rhizophagus irregularis TaxID=588596 RepID=A0A2N0PVV3_9GLOM|nr:hypothetical protein RhiirA5_413664 [Rhizophagus irregularis]
MEQRVKKVEAMSISDVHQLKCGNAERFDKGSGGLPKNGKPKDSFRRASKKRKPKDSRLSRLPCSEERKKPRFDWMGFHILKNRKILKIHGLLTFGKRETKIRLTVRVLCLGWASEKLRNQDSFGWASENRKKEN